MVEAFSREYRGKVIVVKVNLVSATLGDTNEFKSFMEELIKLTDCEVAVDLSTCNHMDSTFIGALVFSLKKLKEKDREMVLIEPNDQSKIFITMNTLSRIFKIHTSIEDAVEDLLSRRLMSKQINASEQMFNAESEANYENARNDFEIENVVNDDQDSKIIENESVLSESGDRPNFKNTGGNDEEIETEGVDVCEQNLEEETVEKRVQVEENVIPEFAEELVEEDSSSGKRDYRDGTIAWDFGN